jgi:hypothetical protein
MLPLVGRLLHGIKRQMDADFGTGARSFLDPEFAAYLVRALLHDSDTEVPIA